MSTPAFGPPPPSFPPARPEAPDEPGEPRGRRPRTKRVLLLSVLAVLVLLGAAVGFNVAWQDGLIAPPERGRFEAAPQPCSLLSDGDVQRYAPRSEPVFQHGGGPLGSGDLCAWQSSERAAVSTLITVTTEAVEPYKRTSGPAGADGKARDLYCDPAHGDVQVLEGLGDGHACRLLRNGSRTYVSVVLRRSNVVVEVTVNSGVVVERDAKVRALDSGAAALELASSAVPRL